MNQLTPVILVAPLDWGLGHATRCVPIIRYLLKRNVKVIIAAEGAQKALLKTEFPEVEIIQLNGYRLKYGKSRWQTVVSITNSIPSIFSSIKKENAWLQQLVKERRIDAIISDNRYGLYHANIYNVFITHQLHIKSPFGRFSEKILQRWNYRQLANFNSCWVPDIEEKINSLGGELSHPKRLPSVDVEFVGPLSRMEKVADKKVGDDFVLVVLSGPEPQRTLLEENLLNQLKAITQKVILVRGLPNETATPVQRENIIMHNHLPAAALNQLMNYATLVICRSGYSSVMDIFCLGKKSIMIPTPGQTEQEYLAKYLSQKNWCVTADTEEFDIKKLIDKALQLQNLPVFAQDTFTKTIDMMLQQLQQR